MDSIRHLIRSQFARLMGFDPKSKTHVRDTSQSTKASSDTRKCKLPVKQKKGEKRMKTNGSVSISQEAFMAVLETEE